MKKRILAVMLAAMMLVSAVCPGLTVMAESAWQQNSEHYDGGDIQYGKVELRSGSSYAILDFAYGHGVSVGETTMQDIAGELQGSGFPVVNPPYSRDQLNNQDFFILMSEDQLALDRLILALEEKAAQNPVTETPVAGVSGSDVSPTDVQSVEDLSSEDISKLFGLLGQLGFSSKDEETSGSDAVSGADVISGSDAVSGSDVTSYADVISSADAVSAADVASPSDAVSSADAVSGADAVSDTDAPSAADISQEDKNALFELLGQLGFKQQVSDSDAGQTVSSADAVSDADAVSGADVVSAADAAVSVADAKVSDTDTDADAQEDADAQPVIDHPAVSDTDSPADTTAEEQPQYDGSAVDTLLAVRTTGVYAQEALPTLEESLKNAFPEFNFGQVEKVALNAVSGQNVSLSDDGCSAQVLVRPESEYVDIELGGKVFTVLMMNQKSTSYSVEHVRVNGSTDPVVTIPTTTETEPETTTTVVIVTEPTTTTTTAAPTTTTTTTTTETTTTTAATTTTTTTTTVATTTTTTTTAAPTTTTTAPTSVQTNPGELLMQSGYVSTRSKDLRVRKGPGLGFAVITLIPKGTELVVLDQPNENWYHVRLNDGTEGYCYRGYITIRPGA